MKLFVTLLALLALLAGDSCALDADNYTAYIEQLSLDEQFVEEYAKWSFELFSQPDYLYGGRHKKFPCALSNSSTVPTSVHALRPSDVRCIGAMGDSLTAGLGAHAHTPIGLLFENRGNPTHPGTLPSSALFPLQVCPGRSVAIIRTTRSSLFLMLSASTLPSWTDTPRKCP